MDCFIHHRGGAVRLCEERGEISLYKKLLSQYGHQEFIEETQSTVTWENMKFSKKMINENARVLIVTSEYHQPRALAMAKSLGMKAAVFGEDLVDTKKRSSFL